MEQTPIKSEGLLYQYSDSTQTPESSSSSRKNEEDDLIHTLSGMKIESTNYTVDVPLLKTKRTFDHRTIEGSPYVTNIPKKLDIHPTPAKDHFLQTHSASLNLTSPPPPPPPPTPILEADGQYSLLIFSSASDDHDTGEHQENALRTALLSGENGCLRRAVVKDWMEWIDCNSLPLPSIVDLLRVHEYEYLAHLEKKCQPSSNLTAEYPYFYAGVGKLDTDTPLVQQSFTAAKRFCGAAMAAVDTLFQNYQHRKQVKSTQRVDKLSGRRAFVIGRPPGHHAGPSGCVPSSTFWKRPDMTSSGFCLLNTVAVAAAYARYKIGNTIVTNRSLQALTSAITSLNFKTTESFPKIAIVDIDVHHGNGTEEIIRNLQPRQVFLPLPSSWAPVGKFSYKPWLSENDQQEVFFSSIQLFGGENFYPGSGLEDPKDDEKNIVNITLTPVGPGPWDPVAREKLTQTKRDAYCKQASDEFRIKVTQRLLPKIRTFQPDLLFISAGFDTHVDDFYHFLTEEDIHWITSELCNIVEENPQSIGVISVLEGGYSLESNSIKPVSATVNTSKSRATRRGAGAATAENNRVIEQPQIDFHTMFGQQPGDGGLVKGVLAHAAALTGRKNWIQECK